LKKQKEKKQKEGKSYKKKSGKESLWITCNPQWNVCGETVIPPHHLDYVLIYIYIYIYSFTRYKSLSWSGSLYFIS